MVQLLNSVNPMCSAGAGSMEASQEAQLSGREKGYVAAVRALNEANISRQPFNAVAAFIAATVTDVTGERLPLSEPIKSKLNQFCLSVWSPFARLPQ